MSFYPQPLLNYRRRSTSGLTVDFPLLNVLGFACYTTYTSALLFNHSIRKEYAIRHPTSPEPTVRLNDFAFALHALIICIVTYTQFWSSLWGFQQLEGKRASRVVQGIFCGSIASLVVVGFIAASSSKNSAGIKSWSAIDVVSSHDHIAIKLSLIRLDICSVLGEACGHLRQICSASMAQLQGSVNDWLVYCPGLDGLRWRRTEYCSIADRRFHAT